MAFLDSNNHVTLKGRIAAEKARYSQTDKTTLVSFRLAYSNARKNEQGEYETRDEFWITCVAFGDYMVEKIRKLKNGQLINITGALQSEEDYTNDKGEIFKDRLGIIVADVTLDANDIASFSLRERKGAPQGAAATES